MRLKLRLHNTCRVCGENLWVDLFARAAMCERRSCGAWHIVYPNDGH